MEDTDWRPSKCPACGEWREAARNPVCNNPDCGENQATRIRELEGAQILNRNAIKRKDGRIRELEAENKALREGWGVKVKPLEWVEHGEGLLCRCQIGEYQVYPTANDRNNKHVVYFVCAKRNSRIVGYCDGKEAAKSATQADYERRILSALSPAPVSVGEAATDELAAHFLDFARQIAEDYGLEEDVVKNDPDLTHAVKVYARAALRALLYTEGE